MNKHYNIKVTEEMGRGLYATQAISAGTCVTQCEVLVLSQADTIKVNETDLQYYTFVFNEHQDCLVLGDGEIFNHADSANVAYMLVDDNGRKIMHFIALKHINEGDQLFINYNQDVKVKTQDYIETKSLMYEELEKIVKVV